MITNHTETGLSDLIKDQIEENLHLDYKGSDSLLNTDSKKREISKDVSAFANSDGGTIIYGIREYDALDKRHLPERIDPIDRTNISKEWLEQIINSHIQPKIPGLIIVPIQLRSSVNSVVYVVEIPQSNTAHQADDKKYYKRYNFESVAMYDYEIKDIINRQSKPSLEFVIDPSNTFFYDDVLKIPLTIINLSIKLAKDVKLTFEIDKPKNCDVVRYQNLIDLSYVNRGKRIFGTTHNTNIYKGLPLQIGNISIRFVNDSVLTFTTTIYADNMEPKIKDFGISIKENQFEYF